MSKYLSAVDFLAGITGKPEDFDVPGLGLIQVRSLTTVESGELRKRNGDDAIALMIETVRKGLVQPALTTEQLEQLGQAKPGIMQIISERIMELSGIIETKTEQEALEKKAGTGS